MASYFLDTSALVKRQIAEPGHNWARSLCAPVANHRLIIAELSLVEVPATYSRMARETPRRISKLRRDRLIADFERAVASQFIIVTVTRPVISRAASLCRTHPLRAYDAVQLASALISREDDLAAGFPAAIFVCADTNLLNVAQAEGFMVENPNNYA
jgi:uncharacterized protein